MLLLWLLVLLLCYAHLHWQSGGALHAHHCSWTKEAFMPPTGG
jgi:hypothetical protein